VQRKRLRYGLRAPFAQERLSRLPDGKVVYKLRRPWPKADGATHLVLEPLDFLRRLAALVSFPYAHQVRYHGIFSGRSRCRELLPPPPKPRDVLGLEAQAEGGGSGTGPDGGAAGGHTSEAPARSLGPKTPWARLLRRALAIDALACPRCSSGGESVPMVVLAFLTDPEVVGRILQHLHLPTCAPALAEPRVAGEARGFELEEEVGAIVGGEDETPAEGESRPPP